MLIKFSTFSLSFLRTERIRTMCSSLWADPSGAAPKPSFWLVCGSIEPCVVKHWHRMRPWIIRHGAGWRRVGEKKVLLKRIKRTWNVWSSNKVSWRCWIPCGIPCSGVMLRDGKRKSASAGQLSTDLPLASWLFYVPSTIVIHISLQWKGCRQHDMFQSQCAPTRRD